MKFIEVDLTELKPYANNPRVNQHAVQSVKESILKYGYKVPIVIDRDYGIVAGHTRHAALLQIKEERGFPTRVHCILADDLTDEQVKEFRIVDNLVAEQSEWDITSLKTELEFLPNLDLNLFGEIPALTLEDIQLQEEAKLEVDTNKITFKFGSDKIELTEREYHQWVSYVIDTHNMTVAEFVRTQLHIDPDDREYPQLEI